MKKKIESGQALVEALIALTLGGIVVSVVTFLTITSLNNSSYTQSQTYATQLAQQGIEQIRILRDKNYTSFHNNYDNHYCMPDDNSLTPIGKTNSCGVGNGGVNNGEYVREIDITAGAPRCSGGSLVESIVTWTDGKCSGNTYCHSAKLNTCLAVDNTLVP